MRKRYQAPSLYLLSALLFFSCNRQRAVVDYAHDMLKAGEYERALELLNRVDSIENAPELDAMRGTILSLESATMVDGMFLMNRTVDTVDDVDLRLNLFHLYIDTGLYTQAAQLVSGERVGPERFFRRDIVRMRSASRCFERPDPAEARKMLEELPRGEEPSDKYYAPVRDSSRFLALLCLSQGIRLASKEADLYWLFDDARRDARLRASPVYSRPYLESLIDTFLTLFAMHDGEDENDHRLYRNRCEMIARLGSVNPDSPVSPPATFDEELKQCRIKFPGSLILRRIWPANLEGLDAERGGPMLFDESPFFPPYVPRPEFEPLAEDSLPDPAFQHPHPQ